MKLTYDLAIKPKHKYSWFSVVFNYLMPICCFYISGLLRNSDLYASGMFFILGLFTLTVRVELI